MGFNGRRAKIVHLRIVNGTQFCVTVAFPKGSNNQKPILFHSSMHPIFREYNWKQFKIGNKLQ